MSASIADAIKRIETVRGLYLAGGIALLGVLFQSKQGDFGAMLAKIAADHYMLTPVLLVPFLNSILLMYVAGAMHFIMAAAKYNAYYLGPRLQRVVEIPVLQFDIWHSDDKSAWLLLRTIFSTLYYCLATSVSAAILVRFADAGKFRAGLIPGIAFLASTAAFAISLVAGLVNLIIAKRFHKSPEPKALKVRRLYWLSVPVAAILYVAFICVF